MGERDRHERVTTVVFHRTVVVPVGVLHYTATSKTKKLCKKVLEMIDLRQQSNRLATYSHTNEFTGKKRYSIYSIYSSKYK